MKSPIAIFLLLQTFCLRSQTTIYVNKSVPGGLQNGLSWGNAFPDLQQALASSINGDEIWVAKGTYYPTTSTDRSISFVLKNGVKIYGGFLGSETNLTQRDFESNETILSGNIGLPKGSDNTYNVLYGEGLDSTTILDGFVVTKGAANGADDHGSGGGLLINPSSSIFNTCPIIQNCRFENNYASVGGGIAISRWLFSQNYANPIIRNCQFVGNRTNLYGGAIAKIGPALIDHPFILEWCTFSNNSSGQDGGAIFFSKTENATMLRNCVFENDTSKFSSGGGFYFASGYEEFSGAILTLDSCIFKANIATEGGGFYYLDAGIPSFSMPPFRAMLSDCLFEENIATNGYGGAYGFVGSDKSSFSVDVIGCEFSGNLSDSNYTTFFQASKESKSTVLIKSCKYFYNKRLGNPSLYCFPLAFGIGGQGSKFDARIENCLFAGNGGGISSLCTSNGGGINTYVNNCTFYNNNEYLFNKSYYSVFNGVDHYANTFLSNCIIWQPNASIWTLFSDNNFMIQKLDGYQVDHCILSLDSNTTNFYPIFGSNNISETDPLFVNASNGDFRLDACSPAVNAGNNAVIDTLGIFTDLDGNPRIRFDTVDIGAYETQDSCFTIGSYQPSTTHASALLSPNPASPGSLLTIQVSGLEPSKIKWNLLDGFGRVILVDKEFLYEKDNLILKAPHSPGIYFIEIQEGTRSVWLKLVIVE